MSDPMSDPSCLQDLEMCREASKKMVEIALAKADYPSEFSRGLMYRAVRPAAIELGALYLADRAEHNGGMVLIPVSDFTRIAKLISGALADVITEIAKMTQPSNQTPPRSTDPLADRRN